jgi:hypothetical protein
MNIWAFGSNLAGRHGKGAALFARQHYGAIYGCGEGIQGSSYAIPTKDKFLRPRTLSEINESVKTFLKYAKDHPEDTYKLTRVGCGLAGFTNYQIAPMFKNYTKNIIIPPEWIPYV